MPARNPAGGAASKHGGIARAGAWSHTVTVPASGSYRAVLESAQTEPSPRLLRVRASRAVSVFVEEKVPLSSRTRRYQLGGDSAIANNPQGSTTYALGGINVKVWGSVEVRAAAVNGQATVKAELLPCLGDEVDTPPMEAVVELTDALEVYTLVIDTATDSEDYGVDLTPPSGDGSSAQDITITADGSTSKAEIIAALVAAWNGNATCALWYTATDDGVHGTIDRRARAASVPWAPGARSGPGP